MFGGVTMFLSVKEIEIENHIQPLLFPATDLIVSNGILIQALDLVIIRNAFMLLYVTLCIAKPTLEA